MPIKITDLNYVYSAGTPFAKHALKNINLEIPDGEFWGVIGHTGSGKSTLFAHLNALTRIQSGTIEIDEFRLVATAAKSPSASTDPITRLYEHVWAWFSNIPNISCLPKRCARTWRSARKI